MSDITLGLSLALFSALATAFAHALLKVGDDKLAVQAWVRLTGFVLAIPIALTLGPPPFFLWPWILGAAAIHAVYQLVLTWSYTVSDFSVAYPIARGVSPVFTALLGLLFLGDELNMLALIGVATVSCGILALSRNRGVTLTGLFVAVLAGLLTTAYSVVDAKGVRLAPYAMMFIAWFYVAEGFSMPFALVLRDRASAIAALIGNAKTGLAAGVMALLAFLPALFAFKLAPVGAVAALRETSVLIGLVLGGIMIKEKIDRTRIFGALLITFGGLMIITGSARLTS